jgi:predicted DNA-binding transcriptional regulator AlpA
MKQNDPLVSATELRKTFGGVSTMTIWRWLRMPNDPLPPPAALIAGRRFWRQSEINDWIARRSPPGCPPARLGQPS